MGAWFIKFLSGFAIWKGPQLGKVLFYSIVALVMSFILWKAFLEKKITNLERYVNCTITQVHPVECPKEPAFELIKLWKLHLFSIR
jgi:biotin transporter BioY